MDPVDAQLLSIAQVAERLSVTEAAVRKWVSQGRVRATKLGRLTRIALADVLELKPVGTYTPPVDPRPRDPAGQFVKSA